MQKRDLSHLTELQRRVTQEAFTEPPHRNEYNTFDEPGIYNCIVCHVPLFTSAMKFACGCGWPAFSECLPGTVSEKEDLSIPGRPRVETLCSNCQAHLGHVFNDGIVAPKYLRYCINSASIKFVPE